MQEEKTTQHFEQSSLQQLEQEIRYLRSLIQAYESIWLYRDSEQLNDKTTIMAYERLSELSAHEKKESEETIQAWQKLAALQEKEHVESQQTIEAFEQLTNLHESESISAKQTIEAFEKVNEMSSGELKQLKEKIETINRITHPLQKEILSILDEDPENEQHIIHKLNLLNIQKNDSHFYSHLFYVLMNLEFDEETSKKYWNEILVLNQEVTEKLGRKVSFRVSMLDYFIDLNRHIKNPKIIEFKFFENTMNEAIFDKLTGLLNRTHLSIALRSSMRNARRDKMKVGVIMFDIDNFKKFNDFFGHLEGDRLLSSLGQILAGIFRGINIAFRYGGEEFLAIVESKEEEPVMRLAEEVRSTFFKTWRECIIPVSLSGGVAIFPDDAIEAEEIVSRADRALYEAKYAGKNTIKRYADNRRHNSRIFASREIAYFSAKDPTHEKSAFTVDVSQGGIAIESREKLAEGDKIVLFLSPEKEKESQVEGVVCWIKDNPQNGSFIHGVEIEDLEKSKKIFIYYGKDLAGEKKAK